MCSLEVVTLKFLTPHSLIVCFAYIPPSYVLTHFDAILINYDLFYTNDYLTSMTIEIKQMHLNTCTLFYSLQKKTISPKVCVKSPHTDSRTTVLDLNRPRQPLFACLLPLTSISSFSRSNFMSLLC